MQQVDAFMTQQIIELEPSGNEFHVCNSTQHHYLVALPQYRLAARVKDEDVSPREGFSSGMSKLALLKHNYGGRLFPVLIGQFHLYKAVEASSLGQ